MCQQHPFQPPFLPPFAHFGDETHFRLLHIDLPLRSAGNDALGLITGSETLKLAGSVVLERTTQSPTDVTWTALDENPRSEVDAFDSVVLPGGDQHGAYPSSSLLGPSSSSDRNQHGPSQISTGDRFFLIETVSTGEDGASEATAAVNEARALIFPSCCRSNIPRQVESSHSNDRDSESNKNTITKLKSRKKSAPALEWEKLRCETAIQDAIAADVATFKAAWEVDEAAAIARLPIYKGGFRSGAEPTVSQEPGSSRRHHADAPQPCVLCGLPILGRGYEQSMKHRKSCAVMAALVEAGCLVDFIDTKEVDMDLVALRQVLPRYRRSRKKVPSKLDRTGEKWSDLKAAMMEEAAMAKATVKATCRKRKRSDDANSRVEQDEPARKRQQISGRAIEMGESLSDNDGEGETDEE